MPLTRPKLRPHYHLEVVEGHGAFILSSSEEIVLRGRLYESVTPLLDGRPVEEICGALRASVAPAKVFYTIKKLEQRGLLTDAALQPEAADAARWSEQGIDPAEAQLRFATKSVTVRRVGVEDEDVRAFRSLLESSAIRVVDDGDLTVVVADHYLRRELQRINLTAIENGKPWMLVKPVGVEIWTGPLFRPGKTACWECLAARMRCNFPVRSYLENVLESRECPVSDFVRTPAAISIAWGVAANAVAAWIARDGLVEPLDGKIQTYNVVSHEAKSHTLLRSPVCPACGQGGVESNGEVRPIVLRTRKKTYTEDGGHRALSPGETIEKYERHVSPICGAVTVLERSTSENNGVMHVYFSGHNIAWGPQDLNGLRRDLRSASCGKGANDLQAKASALCEGLERYSGVFRGDEPRRKARMAELGDDAIHPADYLLFSETQYAQREERNKRPSVFNHIPMPFDPDEEIDWTPVWSLTHDTVRYLPTALCYFNYPQNTQRASCLGCSNGNAAGNNLEEATLQGFLELVERDGIAAWWYNRLRMPGVDLESVDEPYLRRLRTYLKKHDHTFWVLDLTSDLGIPVFAAISQRLRGPSEQIMFGFGAHFDPRIALMRSITELNQMLVVLIRSGKEGVPPEFSDAETSHWLKQATLREHPYLKPKDGPLRTLHDYPHTPTDDIKEDVLQCQSLVEQQGLEMLVLDQTREEVGLPAVKVFVPGLRHFWARFAPGRLYDVPVTMGWLDSTTLEKDLNPVPMFL
ncbi:MAG: TOMM precursor leader peptide-binding protein [Pirellulaceae bacterium]